MLWWSADNLDTPLIVHTALFVMHSSFILALYFSADALAFSNAYFGQGSGPHSVGQCPL